VCCRSPRIWLTPPLFGAIKHPMGRKAATATISDALRDCLRGRSVSLSRIASDTGIVKSSLIRFLREETSLRLDKADLLAEYLKLEVVNRKEP